MRPGLRWFFALPPPQPAWLRRVAMTLNGLGVWAGAYLFPAVLHNLARVPALLIVGLFPLSILSGALLANVVVKALEWRRYAPPPNPPPQREYPPIIL